MAILAGCGSNYRPVVNAVGIVGPAGQPQKFAVALSSPSPTSNGLMTMVDFSGDTVLVTTPMGLNPYYLALNSGGQFGYTLNSDGTLNSFQVTTSLIASDVLFSTLLPGASPVSIFAGSSSVYLSDPGVNAVDQLVSQPPALKQELTTGTGYTPVYVVGQGSSPRAYSISQSTSGGLGQVQAIETAGNTISNTIPVGHAPIYGVMTVDDKRAFILNQKDNTVTAINVATNELDTPLNTIAVGPSPVWADLASGLDELVVVNEGTGTSTGSVSIINIPLCSTTAQPITANCDPTNPSDATNFGQVVATIPVGVNPIMVSVLSDYTRAYVANAGVAGLPCATVAVPNVSTTCTVSVINLSTNTVTATINIDGHPAYIATSAGTPTGKVYVVCKDRQDMTVIETDTDSVDLTIPLQGYGVSVRTTAP